MFLARRAQPTANRQCVACITVLLCLQTFEMRKHLFNLSLAEPKLNAKAVLKMCELFIYREIHFVTNLFCKNVLKIVTPWCM
jgi:hypothetical protein